MGEVLDSVKINLDEMLLSFIIASKKFECGVLYDLLIPSDRFSFYAGLIPKSVFISFVRTRGTKKQVRLFLIRGDV